jgi:hypothetical protein
VGIDKMLTLNWLPSPFGRGGITNLRVEKE